MHVLYGFKVRGLIFMLGALLCPIFFPDAEIVGGRDKKFGDYLFCA